MADALRTIIAALEKRNPRLDRGSARVLAMEVLRLADEAEAYGEDLTQARLRVVGGIKPTGALGALLRDIRDQAGLSQAEAAELFGCSLSKISRVELGEVSVSVSDVRSFIQIYRITDRQLIEDLFHMASGHFKDMKAERSQAAHFLRRRRP
jgi:hypothetical protein